MRSALLIIFALHLPRSATAADEVDALLQRLTARGAKTRTLQATFVQRKRIALFASEVVTRGILRFQKPHSLRWETLPPDESLILIRKDRMELHLPGAKPRTISLATGGTAGALVEQLLFWLGGVSPQGWRSRYSISLKTQKSIYLLRLVPRSGPLRQHVARLSLVLGQDLLPRSIQIDHPGGDTTNIMISQMKLNKKLPSGSFNP